jgi:hypothetical protein
MDLRGFAVRDGARGGLHGVPAEFLLEFDGKLGVCIHKRGETYSPLRGLDVRAALSTGGRQGGRGSPTGG